MNNNISINYDLDLFCDLGTIIFHYATAGGYIPKSIFNNPKHQRIRASLLNNKINFDYKLNPALDEIFSIKFESQKLQSENFDREAYLKDFIFYAKKGCFSFDRTFISNHLDNRYHLVAYPVFDNEYENSFLGNKNIDEIVRKYFRSPEMIFY